MVEKCDHRRYPRKHCNWVRMHPQLAANDVHERGFDPLANFVVRKKNESMMYGYLLRSNMASIQVWDS